MITLVWELPVGSTLADDQVYEYTNFTFFVLWKQNAAFIDAINGGTITWYNALEGLSHSNQWPSLNSKRPRPLKVMGLNSSKPMFAWWTLPKMNMKKTWRIFSFLTKKFLTWGDRWKAQSPSDRFLEDAAFHVEQDECRWLQQDQGIQHPILEVF